ncbi:hypothetical protein PHLGIDRAFT_123001 [Phlebiopsis gigantea 11061_1 CR5-6]|uniref:Ribosomal RNA methyltransferase FtsJ domain-containing protein n=1 Tax=Phlebiopsis gigantea (strain 11061_1 CR5-6) TaxID=745531 RepID=A0A0C3RQ76_PHLG1|nr:hypothetical protein PHLGIDRAFT_123001 [Phlebiopsis gigantea 11061_1 CR5-6]
MPWTRKFQHQAASIDDDGEGLKGHLVKFGASELYRLGLLREVGWQDKGLDGHFQQQRYKADNGNSQANKAWFDRMRVAFGELDSFSNFVPLCGPFKFLDLGCCPGGFTSYILQKNSDAVGVGISLPVIQSGHHYLLERHLRPRFTLHMADMLYYSLHPPHTPAMTHGLNPLPDDLTRQFDLVMLDGHQLRTYSGPARQDAEDWDRHRLFVSQFVIALRTVKAGGTMVVKMSHPERAGTGLWLMILDKLSGSLTTRKPRTIHSNRGTFYVIAKEVGLGREGNKLDEYMHALERLWYEISFGGDEGKGRALTVADLSFAATYEEMVSEASLLRLVELGNDPWTVQADALQQWFMKKGLL